MNASDNTAVIAPLGDEEFGALVGWESEDLGERLVLRMQSVRSIHRRSEGEMQRFSYFVTRNQAVLLGNYLFKIAGQTPPSPRKTGWLRRLFG